ncbi:hypothetical protein AKJ09_10433 [Labilithrix luteola]|uniref:Uncharacterized protein n=1 Tax=Labilithrix luteola TaxID=1391654 RepID=A0A0K1QEC9_9BACT|nr:hypothetical protein AKJ09_10433 [Labilithrix luteola]
MELDASPSLCRRSSRHGIEKGGTRDGLIVVSNATIDASDRETRVTYARSTSRDMLTRVTSDA